MRLIRRLAGRGTSPGEQAIDPELQALLDEHGLSACDRQLALGELLGEHDWSFSQDDGVLKLGYRSYHAQILGTTSKQSRTWLWAWDNPSIDERLTGRAREAARIGNERGISFLVEPKVDEARIGDAHLIGLAVTGLINADAYYRGTHPGGDVVILISEPRVRQSPDRPDIRAISVITQALNIPHLVTQAGVEHYLRALGLPVSRTATEVRMGPGGEVIFRFDELGRLAKIDGTIEATSAEIMPLRTPSEE